MNILQINERDAHGGAAVVARMLLDELNNNGHNSSLLVRRKTTDHQNVHEMNVRYKKVLNILSKLLNKRDLAFTIPQKTAYFFANDVNIASSNHILKSASFKESDIVNLHNIHGNYFNLKILKKISEVKPLVWTLHDMWAITPHCAFNYEDDEIIDGFYKCPSKKMHPSILWDNTSYLRKIKAKSYESSDLQLVVPSQWLKERVSRTVLKDKPIEVIYNGIDESIFLPESKLECRNKYSIPVDKKVILYLGKNNPWDGSEFIHQISKEFDDNYLFLVLGTKKQDISNVRYIGYVKDKKILSEYYSLSDVFLYPSVSDNCPLVILEAMSCGLPVVSFNTGGISELVIDGVNGFIADYRKVDQLVKGLIKIFNLENDEFNAMRKLNRERVLKYFTKEKMIDNYIKLYSKLISEV